MVKCGVVMIALSLCILVDNVETQGHGVFHLVMPTITWTNLFWQFEPMNCTLKCTAVLKLTCQQLPTPAEVCATMEYRHFCCHQQFISSSSTTTTTTTTTTTSTTTTSTTTTSTTTPSTTTSTEDPLSQLCGSAEETPETLCDPEPGCGSSPSNIATIHSYWKTPLSRSGGCAARCWDHCFEPCACKTAAGGRCDYQPANGLCRARNICEDALFEENECRRPDSFYSSAGFLCHQNKEERNCGDGKTVFAVNIAGEMLVDKRGIVYREDKGTIYEDMYNTKRDYDVESVLDDIEDDDKELYGRCIVGVANGTDFGQCLRYAIKVAEDGIYELGIRTVEPQYVDVGKRLFSLTLNDVLLAANVDLKALSPGNQVKPIDIIVKFTLETKGARSRRSRILIIDGLAPVALPMTNYLHVGLCISECRFCIEYSTIDPGYVIAGLSLVRFPIRTSKRFLR